MSCHQCNHREGASVRTFSKLGASGRNKHVGLLNELHPVPHSPADTYQREQHELNLWHMRRRITEQRTRDPDRRKNVWDPVLYPTFIMRTDSELLALTLERERRGAFKNRMHKAELSTEEIREQQIRESVSMAETRRTLKRAMTGRPCVTKTLCVKRQFQTRKKCNTGKNPRRKTT
eukprot:TRINITY_DN1766_c0_g1_i1.p2 TRINITY_DN1766_c0_g1~~TRINITY_DN1766_c0_g1_i1.p2  ORF type:complete len:176 (-),score=36.78 TRINITY_DN1766_c0_g1_i1:495-1022(-)